MDRSKHLGSLSQCWGTQPEHFTTAAQRFQFFINTKQSVTEKTVSEKAERPNVKIWKYTECRTQEKQLWDVF